MSKPTGSPIEMDVRIHRSNSPVAISFSQTGIVILKVTILLFGHPVFQSPTPSILRGSPEEMRTCGIIVVLCCGTLLAVVVR